MPRVPVVSAGMRAYDVAVIGAGPVGCVAALASARLGRSVVLLEARPESSRRFAGEWLHPPAIRILNDLGVDLRGTVSYPSGQGFVVYPDDGSGPVVLPYDRGSTGFSGDHGGLVATLRSHCGAHPNITYLEHAKVTRIDGQRVIHVGPDGGEHEVRATQIVGASGRASVVQDALGMRRNSGTYSRMAGLLLEDAVLPFEGYGHVCLGGLGPVLAYRVGDRRIRVCIDVPVSLRVREDAEAVLYEAYAHALPESIRPAFRDALHHGKLAWAANQIRPRVAFGREGLALVGDAVGYHHPLTALGMTLGFQDAVTLAHATSFSAYRRRRILGSRVPEMLAVALYEVFADTSDEVVVIRSAIYDLWRRSAAERARTMRFLGCQETGPIAFGSSFLKALALASRALVRQGRSSGRWNEVAEIGGALTARIRWLLFGTLHLTTASPQNGPAPRAAEPKASVVEHPENRPDPLDALRRSAGRLAGLQAQDGSWEGEVVWCPMLAAQYVITCHLLDRPVDPERRRRFLLHFERTRLPDGTWGLHEFLSEPYLFVTSLVYVAARLLGVAPDDPLVARGLAFIRAEGGVVAIPSWGKFWLAMMNLYRWDGVSPTVPEAWGLPRWMPVHPSRFYCHTRLIYLAMAALYGERATAPRTPLIDALRDELYPQGYEAVDFRRARVALRRDDLFTVPGRPLRAIQQFLVWVDRLAGPKARGTALGRLRDHIRFELRATNFTSISPVSGLLNVLALHAADREDPDAERAFAALEEWIWEDDVRGARVAGARSATWDTGLAVQALAAADAHVARRATLERADAFLASQQMRASWPDAERFGRTDPRGGYCFSRVRHGWPVSDCTAEALLGRLESPCGRPSEGEVASALGFILRCRNRDGGFSAYEPRRLRLSLEWLNPAEMFAGSMTESSFVECTASCVSAIARAVARFPSLRGREDLPELERAVADGVRFLREAQHRDGSWPGAWGVRLIYGTMFGIRGLTGAGVPPTDPTIRKACAWLKSAQRTDGSWSERNTTADDPRVYIEGEEGQVTQTAWALLALLEAKDPDWEALGRAAGFLASAQGPHGEWPQEDPAGIFFRTALLDYALYKSYFPVWALAQYASRRKERGGVLDPVLTRETDPRAVHAQRPSGALARVDA